MYKQRNLFFGRAARKSPKKNGLNRPVPERRRTPIRLRDVDIRFTNKTATQFGGYPIWDAFLRRIDLQAKLAQHIKMDRGEGFTAPELSRFFLDSRILGCKRLHHVDRIRFDPILTQSYGLDTLASDESLGRYFKSYGDGHLGSLDRLNVKLNNFCWKKSRKKRRGGAKEGHIILDYDSSNMTVYGKQEGADRGWSFRKKDNPGFQPKFAFIGGLGIMVNQALYPQSTNLDKDFEAFHKESKAKLPKTAKVWAIRSDSALYSEARIERIEREKLAYGISAPRTSHLFRAIGAIPEEAWEEGKDDTGRTYSIVRISYRPDAWKTARTYIISRRLRKLRGQKVLWSEEKYKYFAYVTNYCGSLFDQFKFCVERCTLENFIKEGKTGFYFNFLPCKELGANRAYLGHVQMAYNLLTWWKVLDAPAGVNRWTVETFRYRIFNICGNLKNRMGRWTLSLPARWPWRTIYRKLAMAGSLVPC
jgi:hypothetical protein